MKITHIIAIAAATALAGCSEFEDHMVDYAELPTAAQEFIETHFAALTVQTVTKDSELFETNYEVIFADGTNIDFDRSGDWTDVECRNPKVPDTIVPAKILEYVGTNYPSDNIVEIAKDRKQYDVELDNNLDLDFASDGTFVRIDS